MKEICLFILLTYPCFKLGVSIAKEMKEEERPSAGIVAAITLVSVWYVVYYFAGVFNLLK